MSTALADCLRYDRWANLALIDGCRGMTEEQLGLRATPSSRSVAELFQHLAGSELTFVLRTKGWQHEGESRHVDGAWPGFEVLRDVLASTGDELSAIAEGLDDGELVVLPYQGERFEYPKGFFLLHAVQHGVEHRTEIKVTLALNGIETPDLDAWFYSEAAGYGREVAG
jgi:uncharacterized damage-inducible protein DinB